MKMIKIKAVSGNETVYKSFYCEDNRSKSVFIKDCKTSFSGFDSLRVVKSIGWRG